MSVDTMRKWLTNHPKALATLFTVLFVLAQAGTVLAGEANGTYGP